MPYRDPEKERAKYRRYQQSHKSQLAAKRKIYNQANPDIYLFHAAKSRAKKFGIAFDITREDVIVPTHCPVFGFPLEHGGKGFHERSPSIDQIDPTKGYTRGNIIVVSFKANRMKQNATIEELRKLADFYESLGVDSTPTPSNPVLTTS